MDLTDEPSNSASSENSMHDTNKDQACESGSCGPATEPLEVRVEPIASHDKRWTTTTWTTLIVDQTTTEHPHTKTKTGWTETLDPSTDHEDPWVTKWVTETVAGSAADPSWTTIVVAAPTTSTTTTTLTPVATSSGTVSALPTTENGTSTGGFDFGMGALIGVGGLAIGILMAGFVWLLYYRAESRGTPASSVCPVQVAPAQGDGQGRDDTGDGRGDFCGKV